MSVAHWVWLQRIISPGSNKLAGALERFSGPEEIFLASEAELKASGVFSAADRQKLLAHDLTDADEILSACRRFGHTILTAADERFPKRLLRIFNPPALLYVKGELPPIDDEVVVAVVGTRRAAEASIQASASLAARLARAGALIVSGGAEGIDGAAHRGALAVGAATVAVLGGGLDVDYPKINAELRKEIAGHGCLLSEYPPGTRPLPGNYHVRNRIIAALSLGTVVIEASEKSGALLTAGHALEQGKDIFVLPGGEDDPAFAGSNRLIEDGAKPLQSAMDILEEYVNSYPHKLDLRTAFSPFTPAQTQSLTEAVRTPAAPPKKPAEKKAGERGAGKKTSKPGPQAAPDPVSCLPETNAAEKQKLPPPQELRGRARLLYDRFPDAASGVDALSAVTGLSAGDLLSALTELEIFGLVEALPGGRYAVRRG